MNICKYLPCEPYDVDFLMIDTGMQDTNKKIALTYLFDDSIDGNPDRLNSPYLEESTLLENLVEKEAKMKCNEGRFALSYFLNSRQYSMIFERLT